MRRLEPCPGHFIPPRPVSQSPLPATATARRQIPLPAFAAKEVPRYQTTGFWEGPESHAIDRRSSVIGRPPLGNGHDSPPGARKLPTAGGPLVQVPGTRPPAVAAREKKTKATHAKGRLSIRVLTRSRLALAAPQPTEHVIRPRAQREAGWFVAHSLASSFFFCSCSGYALLEIVPCMVPVFLVSCVSFMVSLRISNLSLLTLFASSSLPCST